MSEKLKKVRLGVIGFGNMGTAHCGNVASGKVPKMELTAICDIAPARIEAAKEKHPDVPVFDNAEDLYKSGLCDLVIIAVPHYDHPGLAEKAFEYGLNVITEKPAGVYTKQVLEMNAAAEKSGKLFGIMYNQRTNPMYQKIRKMVKNGELGHIKRISWIITNWYRPQAYHDSCAWRSTWKTEGGGALINQNPHQLDLWQWMFGMPDRIKSFVSFGKYYDIEVEDDVTTYVEYENGATGVFITSTGDAHGTNRLEIQLDRARIVVENGKISLLVYEMTEQAFSKTNTEPFATVAASKVEVETDGENPQHVGVINAWGGAILRGEPLVADGSEGINGLTLSNAMHLSSWLGHEVKLPLDEALFYGELMKRVAGSKKANVKEAVADTAATYGGNG